MKLEKQIFSSFLIRTLFSQFVLLLILLAQITSLLIPQQSYTLSYFKYIADVSSYADKNIYVSYDDYALGFLNMEVYGSVGHFYNQMSGFSHYMEPCAYSLSNTTSMIKTLTWPIHEYTVELATNSLTLITPPSQPQIGIQYTSTLFGFSKEPNSTLLYQLLVSNVSNFDYTTTINNQANPGAAWSFVANFSGRAVGLDLCEGGLIVVLYQKLYTNGPGQTQLNVYNPDMSIVYSKIYNQTGTNYEVVCSYNHISYLISNSVHTINMSTRNQWTSTSTMTIGSIKMIYPWLCILQLGIYNKLKQYHIISGQLYDTRSVNFSQFTLYFDTYAKFYHLIGFQKTQRIAYDLKVTEQYVYVMGVFQCKAGYYLHDGKCAAQVPTTIYSLLSPSNSTNNTQNKTLPQNNTIIPVKPLKPTHEICSKFYSDQSHITIDFNSKIQYYCQVYCRSQCRSCQSGPDTCTECSDYYIISNQKGNCQLQTSVFVLSVLYAFANSIKCSKSYAVFAFLNNLDLYQYHRIQYTGILHSIFKFLNFMQKKQWELVPIQPVHRFFDKTWFQNKFIPYTNPYYRETERKDLNFLQNIKQYLVLYIPVTCILFLVLNRLFYFSFNYKISILFRMFSFWLYLIGLIALNDVQRIAYLACMQLMNLYHFDIGGLMLQGLSIIIIGIWFLGCFSIYFMYQYLYGAFSNYFNSNLDKNNKSTYVMVGKFIIKPIIQGIIHSTMYQNPVIQLATLTGLQLISFSASCVLQMRYEIFRIKAIFVIDCLLDLMTCLMNLYLYIKHLYAKEVKDPIIHRQLTNKVEDCVIVLVNVMAFALIIEFVMAIGENLRELIKFKLRIGRSTKNTLNLQVIPNKLDNNFFLFKRHEQNIFNRKLQIQDRDKQSKKTKCFRFKQHEKQIFQEKNINFVNKQQQIIIQKQQVFQTRPIQKRLQNQIHHLLYHHRGKVKIVKNNLILNNKRKKNKKENKKRNKEEQKQHKIRSKKQLQICLKNKQTKQNGQNFKLDSNQSFNKNHQV